MYITNKISLFLVFVLVGSILPGVYAQNETASTTPASSSVQICPAVCVPLWRLDGSTCQYTDCGSGCGPDSMTTFKTETECKAKIVTTSIPTTTAVATAIPISKCSLPNADGQLVADGTCKIISCYSGWLDKDGRSDNGCEVQSATQVTQYPLPVCSKDQSWACKTDVECSGAGLYWCGDKCFDKTCPTCSRDQSWVCRDKTSCIGAGANWCQSPGSSTGWCQQDSCPTYTCNQKEPWNCKTDADCINSGLKWCKYQWGDAKCDFSCPEIAKPACPIMTTGMAACRYGEEESVSTFDSNGCQTGNYCRPKDICTTEWRPVCGDNGVTYSNICRAKSAGAQIRYEGECGTKTICDERMVEEKYKKCQIEGGSPEKYKRPDGCADIFCKYSTVRPQPVPSECTEEKDPVTGFIKYRCAARGGPGVPACPIIREEDRRYAKDKCYAHGGTPDYRKSAEGCEYLDCNFGKKDGGILAGAECLAENQIKEVENKCNSLGLKTVYKATKIGEGTGGPEKICKSARCIEPPRSDGCPTNLPPESKIICPQGAMETVGIDERGCNILKCVTKEEKECPQPPPKEAFLKCEYNGGRMVVKQDERGCARFVECVSGRDEDIYVEKVKKVPDTIEVLQFALKLEEMKITLDTFGKKIDKIADYYKAKSPTDYEKYKRVKALLSTAVNILEGVKVDMRSKIDTLTTDDIETFKYRIKEIKQVFKRILFVMLGGEEAKEEFTSKEDCGTSSECMENAFKLCKPAKISQPGGQISEVAIVGLEGDKCVLKWTGGAESMTCKFENYTLGTKNIGSGLENNLEKYCEGSLVKYLSKMVASAPTMRSIDRPVLNSVVNAVKLSQDPNDYRYVFTATDPDGVKEFSIAKSNFDGILIFSSYGSSDDKCVKEAKSSEIKLNPKDFPLTVSVDDCGQQVFRHEMKMDISLKTEPIQLNRPPETIEQPLDQGEIGQAQKPGPVVDGRKLSSDPNDLKYRFTAHDADGIREFYIEKKNFDNVYVKIDPPCSKEAAEEVEFNNPSELPNPFKATVMDCGTPSARTELKVYIESPEQPEIVVMPTLQPVQQVLVATPTQTI